MKKILVVAVGVAVSLCAGAGEIESRVKWICPQEPFPQGIGKIRYYRHAFMVRAGLTNAVARWWCDDRGTLFVDGNKVPGGSQRINPGGNVTTLLRQPGRHVLAVQDENLAGKGGVCLSLELAYADGTVDHAYTSDAWLYATQAPANWKAVDFDDAKWAKARVHGDALLAPWCALAEMSLLLLPDEKAARAAELSAREVRLATALKRMEGETKPVCRIVYDRGMPWFDIGGRRFGTAFYNTSEDWSDDNRHLRRQVAHFRDAGMHLYGVGVDTRKAWKPDGSIDFERAIEPMRSALAIDPEARFFYSINTLLPPYWWAQRNPNELVGYANGKVELGQFECLKNCAAGSAASEVWRRDVCDYHRRLVEYLESTPYAKRIFAYRVDWGANHEWHYYGMRGYMPDAGPAMTAAFRVWLRKAYGGDVAALRTAWRDPAVTFETAQTPAPAARLKKSAGTLRDPVLDRAVIDYERCHAATLRDLLLVSNRSVKEACGGRALVGNYGGYFFGMPETAEGWHLENDAVLDSPYVDFQCSPQVYGRDSRMPGGVQYARCLLEALRRRGKLSIQEADNSTTTFPVSYNHWSKDTEGDIALLARDFVQTLCWGCGFWYFDFGQGWYSDPAFADYFRKIYPIRAQQADCSSVSEVLVVGDYESVMFSNVDWPPPASAQTITRQVNELGGAGVPFDSASFKDLASGTLRPYRVYLFPNFHYATPEKLAVVDRIRAAGGSIVWIGTPGTLSPAGHDPKGVAKPADRIFPDVASRQDLRAFFREKGVHVYCDDTAAAVYACASYVALHNAEAGKKTLRLPRRAKVTEVYPETRPMGTVQEIVFDARGPATTLFRVEAE